MKRGGARRALQPKTRSRHLGLSPAMFPSAHTACGACKRSVSRLRKAPRDFNWTNASGGDRNKGSVRRSGVGGGVARLLPDVVGG